MKKYTVLATLTILITAVAAFADGETNGGGRCSQSLFSWAMYLFTGSC